LELQLRLAPSLSQGFKKLAYFWAFMGFFACLIL